MKMKDEGIIDGNPAILFLIVWSIFFAGIGTVLFDSIRGILPSWIRPIFLQISMLSGIIVVLMMAISWYLERR